VDEEIPTSWNAGASWTAKVKAKIAELFLCCKIQTMIPRRDNQSVRSTKKGDSQSKVA
jgi:hypothetical protein